MTSSSRLLKLHRLLKPKHTQNIAPHPSVQRGTLNSRSRLFKLRSSLKTQNLSAILVTTPSNIVYLTGYHHLPHEISLLVTTSRAYLFCSALVFDGLKTKSPFHLIKLSHQPVFYQKLSQIITASKITRLGFEADNLTAAQFTALRQALKPIHVKLLATSLVENLRQIKDASEIALIKKSCLIVSKTMDFLSRQVRPGKSETELAWLAEKHLREHGADSLAFPIIVASGPNSAIPHHTTSNRKIAKNDLVLIDIGCKVNGYCSDMTRTFFVGKPTSQMLKIRKIVKKAHQAALSTIHDQQPTISQIDVAARQVIQNTGFGDYFIHGTGHSLGLDIHEDPFISPKAKSHKLKANMVVTIEPGIYLPGRFGYRHEDTILITKTGYQLLT